MKSLFFVEETLMQVADSLGDEVFGLCSGGKDSMTACYVANEHRKLDAIVTVDTTCAFFIMINGQKVYPAHEAARAFAESVGVPFILIKNKNPNAFRDYCIKYGMPHTSQHGDVYHELKWKPLMAFVRSRSKKNASGKLVPSTSVLISGVRKAESKKRVISAKPAQVDEGCKRARFVSPIIHWRTEDVWAFVREKGFKLSETYDAIHISGDCGCGAYSEKCEAMLVKMFYPDYYEWLKEIESVALKITSTGIPISGWGTGATLESIKGQRRMCDYACGDCQNG